MKIINIIKFTFYRNQIFYFIVSSTICLISLSSCNVNREDNFVELIPNKTAMEEEQIVNNISQAKQKIQKLIREKKKISKKLSNIHQKHEDFHAENAMVITAEAMDKLEEYGIDIQEEERVLGNLERINRRYDELLKKRMENEQELFQALDELIEIMPKTKESEKYFEKVFEIANEYIEYM